MKEWDLFCSRQLKEPRNMVLLASRQRQALA